MSSGHSYSKTTDLLYAQPYNEMKSDFEFWRISDHYKLINSNKKLGQILPFIRGLRISTRLIYAIRKFLNDGLYANWGHLLDDDGVFCSRECDIIIHKGKAAWYWNGEERSKPVMDFRFIKKNKAIVVISCKSFIDGGKIDKNYCEQMKTYIKKIWLFAECCGPKNSQRMIEKSQKYGYEKFWHLYTWNKKTDKTEENREGWNNFVSEIKKLR